MEKFIPYIIFITIIACFLIIVLSSRQLIHKVYKKFKRVKNSIELDGKTFVFMSLEMLKLSHIKVATTKKRLSDCYVPSRKTLILSDEVLNSDSVVSLTIISHELGHAVQDRDAYPHLRLSQLLSCFTKITNKLMLPFLIVGGILCFFMPLGFTLLNFSILFFGLHLGNKLLDIPIEKNASNFAKQFLIENQFVSKKELRMAKRLLYVAQLTYVASLFDGILFFKFKKN